MKISIITGDLEVGRTVRFFNKTCSTLYGTLMRQGEFVFLRYSYMGLFFLSLAMLWNVLSVEASAINKEFQHSEMKAGIAATAITPDEPLVTVNGRIPEGVHSDIKSKALVLNDGDKRLVFITSDLNCHDVITPYLRARVQDELGFDPSQLILLVTHNHNAPIQINPDNFDYGRQLADDIFDLIVEAMENEKGPVSLKYGNGYDYLLESVGSVPVDYEMQLLKVEYEEEPMAVLFSHGTHPYQSTYTKIDAGHPGVAMDKIEEIFPGVQAMYATSGGGNQFPRNRAEQRDRISELLQAETVDFEYINSIMEETAHNFGEKVADLALDILSGDMVDITGPLTSRIEIFSLPFADPMPEEEARQLAEELDYPEDVGFVHYPHEHRGTNWVRVLLRYYDEEIPFPKETTDMIVTWDTFLIHKEDDEFLEKYDYAIHERFPTIFNEAIVATIGTMPFVALQGEVAAPILGRIKDEFRADGPIIAVAYMGKHNLYIPTRELVRQDVYQPRTLQTQYASPVGWDPSVEDVKVNKTIDLIRTALEELD